MRICYRIYSMEKIIEKRGRYMDSWTPAKKREYMAQLARKKWSSMDVEDRIEHGRKLALSRKAKIIS